MTKKTTIIFLFLISFVFSSNAKAEITQGVIGYYHLDGNSNDVLNDHNGVDENITYTSNNCLVGQCAVIANNPSKINLGSLATGNYDISVSFWAYTTNSESYDFFYKQQTTASDGFRFYNYSSPDGLRLRYFLYGGDIWGQNLTTTMTFSQWTNFVWTLKNNNGEYTGKLYKNGVLVNTQVGYSDFLPFSATDFFIGRSVNIGELLIDEFIVYDREITQNEVTELFNNGNPTDIFYIPPVIQPQIIDEISQPIFSTTIEFFVSVFVKLWPFFLVIGIVIAFAYSFTNFIFKIINKNE